MVDASIAASRPRALSAVLDGGVRLFRHSLLGCIPYALIAVAAGQLPSIYDLVTGQPLRGFHTRDPLWWAIYLVATAVLLTMWSALVLRQWRVAAGQPLDARRELAAAVQALPALAALVIMGVAAFVVGALLFILPGVYVFIVLVLSAPLLLIERRGPWSAWNDARALVSNVWWRAATLIALSLLVTVFSILVCFAIGNLVAGLITASIAPLSGVAGSIASGVLALLVGALALLLWSALLVVVYRDLKLRKPIQ